MGARTGAGNLHVDITVDDIVEGAASPAHQDRPGQHQDRRPPVKPKQRLVDGGQCQAPGAGPRTATRSRWAGPIAPARIGLEPIGSIAVDPVAGLGIGDGSGLVHFRHGQGLTHAPHSPSPLWEVWIFCVWQKIRERGSLHAYSVYVAPVTPHQPFGHLLPRGGRGTASHNAPQPRRPAPSLCRA